MCWPAGTRVVLALHAASVCALLWAANATPGIRTPAPLVDIDLFRAGDGDYACYRLPNLVMLRPAGHMLAIVQGHKFDCSDGGRMDVLLRRTVDGGTTWGPTEFVYGESTAEKNVTMGTPAAVVDLVGDEANGVAPGTVFLFVCRDFKHVLLLSSSNGGVSCECPCHAGSTCSSLLQQVLSAQVRVPLDARLCFQGVDHEISPRTFLQPDGRASGRACPKEFNCRMGV